MLPLLLPLLLAAASSPPPAAAATHIIKVGAADHKFSPDSVTAVAGDIISFQFYPTNHSVVRMDPTYPCKPYELVNPSDAHGGWWSGFRSVEGFLSVQPSWELRINDTKPLYFYCSAPQSCTGFRMVGGINVDNSTFPISAVALQAGLTDYSLSPGETWLPESHPTTTPSSPSPGTTVSVVALSPGAIAGIVVGVLAVLAISAGAFFFVGRRRKGAQSAAAADDGKGVGGGGGGGGEGPPGYTDPRYSQQWGAKEGTAAGQHQLQGGYEGYGYAQGYDAVAPGNHHYQQQQQGMGMGVPMSQNQNRISELPSTYDPVEIYTPGPGEVPEHRRDTPTDPSPRPAIAIGLYALDLRAFTHSGGFTSLPPFPHSVFTTSSTLNAFAALGHPTHRLVRTHLQSVLAAPPAAFPAACLHRLSAVTTHLPLQIGDYTDFYAGRNHAWNLGRLLRGSGRELQENYECMPIGYNGRSSTVVVSGTCVRRPYGQIRDPGPVFAPTKRLDYELELAAFVCTPSVLGAPVSVRDARQHVFGLVLMNDWSARDVQAWEYVPLGPFNGKSFATTVGAWVLLVDAVAPFMVAPLERGTGVPLLPYLQEGGEGEGAKTVYEIALTVGLRPATTTEGEGEGETYTTCRTSSRNLIWSFPQMIAHQTANGCALRTGDLLGSGTISGVGRGECGSMMELSMGGKEPVVLGGDGGGVERAWVQDGDTVVMEGWCGEGVGFGSVVGRVLPAWGTETEMEGE